MHKEFAVSSERTRVCLAEVEALPESEGKTAFICDGAEEFQQWVMCTWFVCVKRNGINIIAWFGLFASLGRHRSFYQRLRILPFSALLSPNSSDLCTRPFALGLPLSRSTPLGTTSQPKRAVFRIFWRFVWHFSWRKANHWRSYAVLSSSICSS